MTSQESTVALIIACPGNCLVHTRVYAQPGEGSDFCWRSPSDSIWMGLCWTVVDDECVCQRNRNCTLSGMQPCSAIIS